MKSLLLFSAIIIFGNSSYSQYVLKWEAENIEISISNYSTKSKITTDAKMFLYESDSLEIEITKSIKGDKDYGKKKNMEKYCISKYSKYKKKLSRDDWVFWKIEGLNSFALYSIEEGKVPAVHALVYFFSKDQKRLFYFELDYEYNNIDNVHRIVESIKFY
jgi:hypothetical protein